MSSNSRTISRPCWRCVLREQLPLRRNRKAFLLLLLRRHPHVQNGFARQCVKRSSFVAEPGSSWLVEFRDFLRLVLCESLVPFSQNCKVAGQSFDIRRGHDGAVEPRSTYDEPSVSTSSCSTYARSSRSPTRSCPCASPHRQRVLLVFCKSPHTRLLTSNGRVIRRRLRRGSASMALQPGINPFRLDPNRSAPADARMPQFAPFAGGVDGVATDAGIDRALSNGQPGFHGVLRACPPRGEQVNCVVV